MDSCNTFAHIQHNCSSTGKVTLKDIKLISSLALTHWVPVMNICISKLTIIESDNDLSLGQCQAIIWTNAGILLIPILGTHFGEIFSKVHTFSFKKMHLKLLSVKWHPFCLCFNVLKHNRTQQTIHCIHDSWYVPFYTLTHLPLDKMVAISRMIFSGVFLWALYLNWNFNEVCPWGSNWQ